MSVLEQLTTALAGRYSVEREIGAGGMATVFLARDLKHERQVAVKVLNPELGALLGVERFLAEIKVTANLQHPNLLPLFDSGEAATPYSLPGSGLLYYVMPFVEGESLRQLLDREKQLPVDVAVRLTEAIASALDYAHRHGVIHRDLKPENILLQDGQPLVADFGIALAVTNAGGNRITQTGLSLGTPAYMSPEQATGDRVIDGRTDIYSLGAILYEMLTGEPPHTGSTAQAVIARVLTDKPRSIRASRDSVPEHVEHAVDRALAKLPADRYATARSFVDALEGRSNSTAVHVANAHARPATLARPHRLTWALAGALVLALGAIGWLSSNGQQSGADEVVRFELPDGDADPRTITAVAYSPNGRRVAYIGRGADNVARVYVRELAAIEAHPLAGTEGALFLAFSPDDRWIAFMTTGLVKKIPVGGGPPVVVASDLGSSSRGLTWSGNDIIVFSIAPKLFSVSASGGTPVELPGQTKTELSARQYPFALDDGDHVAYVNWIGHQVAATISLTSRSTGITDTTTVRGGGLVGMIDDHLFYIDQLRGLSAIKVDRRAGRFVGNPVQVISDGELNVGGAGISAAGDLVYRSSPITTQLVVRSGERVRTIGAPANMDFPRLSPDGQRVAVSVASGGRVDIHIVNIATGVMERLTTQGTQNDRAEWTPDGKVLYASNRDGPLALWVQAVDAGAPATKLLELRDRNIWQGVISPDGKYLAYRTGTLNTSDVFYRRLDGDSTERVIANSPSSDQSPQFSPDMKWIAYASTELGTAEVYVRPFPSLSARYRVSRGGRDPIWAQDGKALYYSTQFVILRARLNVGSAISVAGLDTVDANAWTVAGSPEMSPMKDGGLLYLKRGDRPARTFVVKGWRNELQLSKRPTP